MNTQTIDHRSPPCKLRVLVVENDPVMREDHATNLTRWKYEPIIAESSAAALLDDARSKAMKHRCHIALVDMRLLDDYDRNDTSGLELARELKRTDPNIVIIMVSGYGDRATAVKALKDIGAVDFIGKEEGPARLRQAIADAQEKVCPCQLIVEWCDGYRPEDLLGKLRLSACEVPCDEPECVVRRLYKQDDVARVNLEPIARYYRSVERAALVERSVILIARAQSRAGPWYRGEMIKLALSRRIQTEVENYRQYVAPYLSNQRTARIEDRTNSSILWDLGAVRYTDIATESRKPLRQWYAAADEPAVIAVLEDLFEKTLGAWYKRGSYPQSNFIYDYYVGCYPKLGQRISDYTGHGQDIAFHDIPQGLRDPVLWVRDHRFKSRFITHWDAYTHGDLHSENIFVDQHGETSVIDYERSEPGYMLRDFVELEADIRLRLLPLTRVELPLAYHLDLLLLAPDQPHTLPEWADLPGVDHRTYVAMHKAFKAIVTLRRLAFELTRFERMDEYYWALLMETLISALRQEPEWDDPEMAGLAKDRALLSAALLCQRLAYWNRSWPSAEGWPESQPHHAIGTPGQAETERRTHKLRAQMAEWDEQTAHLAEVRRTLRLRLNKLELKESSQGISTPPEVINELNELKQKIAQVEHEIQEIEQQQDQARQELAEFR